MSYRQLHWMEYLSHFKYDISHEAGVKNVVLDCFSQYYANDQPNEVYLYDNYINANVRLDQNGEDLPIDHFDKHKNMRVGPRLADKPQKSKGFISREALYAMRTTTGHKRKRKTSVRTEDVDPLALAPADGVEPLKQRIEGNVEFLNGMRQGYKDDPTFSKVILEPSQYANFDLHKGLLYMKNQFTDWVLCVPRAKLGKRILPQVVIDHTHTVLGHFGFRKTDQYIRRWYWWPMLAKDADVFCRTCSVCQASKPSNQSPAGLLHSLPVPTRPWGSIAMDFVGPFPMSADFNYLWVVICHLTSMVHLVPIQMTTQASDLA